MNTYNTLIAFLICIGTLSAQSVTGIQKGKCKATDISLNSLLLQDPALLTEKVTIAVKQLRMKVYDTYPNASKITWYSTGGQVLKLDTIEFTLTRRSK